MIDPKYEIKNQDYVSIESLQIKLLNEKLLTQDQIRVILDEKRTHKKSFIHIASELGFINPDAMKSFLVKAYQLNPFSPTCIVINPAVLKVFPQPLAERHKIFPFQHDDTGLHVAMADINDVKAYDKIREYFEFAPIIPYVATTEEIIRALEQSYGQLNLLDGLLSEFADGAPKPVIDDRDALPIRFINSVIMDAVNKCVSDIHFEPKDSYLSIRLRRDGILQERCVLHSQYWLALLNRLKIMSGLNIAESRLPQIGRFSLEVGGRTIDFRASCHPTCHGESIVLRVLDKFQSLIALEDLGFFPEQISLLQSELKHPEGLIILTGPTGSGKTTTLYSMLSYLSATELNIMTLEDPIEYELPGVRQTQIDEYIGLTFAEGIRSILRQDPDVVLIGEIRDEATARMALRASMTGHLVLGTLHTKDALGAASRLIDLGVPAPLLSGNINCVVAQRLLRRLCPHCKKPQHLPAHLKPAFGIGSAVEQVIYAPNGCPACDFYGYRGRIAVAEILPVDESLDELLITQQSRRMLRDVIELQNFQDVATYAKRLILNGITSLQEFERVVYLNHEVLSRAENLSI
jgi:type II secretory ATPase GspE/PulE/Tfp pilus assembly ATPase PilB-like protein